MKKLLLFLALIPISQAFGYTRYYTKNMNCKVNADAYKKAGGKFGINKYCLDLMPADKQPKKFDYTVTINPELEYKVVLTEQDKQNLQRFFKFFKVKDTDVLHQVQFLPINAAGGNSASIPGYPDKTWVGSLPEYMILNDLYTAVDEKGKPLIKPTLPCPQTPETQVAKDLAEDYVQSTCITGGEAATQEEQQAAAKRAQLEQNFIIENSKYSQGPMKILLFRSVSDANNWLNDMMKVAAIEKGYQQTMKWTDRIWNYLIKPIAKFIEIPAVIVNEAQKGSRALTDWINEVDKKGRVGNAEKKYRSGMPDLFTVKPGEESKLSKEQLNKIRQIAPFEVNPDLGYGNKELISVLAIGDNNQVLGAHFVPVTSDIIGLTLKKADGKYETAFKEKIVGARSSQYWRKLADQVMAKYGSLEKLKQIEQSNIKENRIPISQVKKVLNIQ